MCYVDVFVGEYWLGLSVRFQGGLVVEEAAWQQGLPTEPGVVHPHIQLCTSQANVGLKHIQKTGP